MFSARSVDGDKNDDGDNDDNVRMNESKNQSKTSMILMKIDNKMAEKLRNFGLPSNLFAYRGGHQNSFEIEYEQIQSTLEIDTGKQQKQQQRRRPCFVLIPENDYHLLRKIIGTSDNDDNQQQQSDDFNLDGKYCRIVTN
uniref:Uncharacterized protein LOC113788774 n=1 Tax=Dermatophagoides pteronyssinus TaxID=6956 RepID=A0A6P6XKJ4_DERPT|nr:uncharacterized protein LOC113788774 [Dermatophagoides pteronyssinus]